MKPNFTASVRSLLAAAILTFTALLSSGQSVIPNGSLENYTYCPTSFAQFNANVLNWWTPVSHGGSADYFNVCSSSTYADAPTNYWGTQTPRTGNAYVGFATYYGAAVNFREYLETQTTSALVAGTTYTLSLYLSLCDQCGYGSDNIAAYISTTSTVGSGGAWGPMSYTPTFVMSTALTDKTSWTLFTGNYVASGGENFLTIGNFVNDAGTTIVAAGSGTIPTLAYYFIDDISLTPSVILGADVTEFSAAPEGSKILLTWNTRSETTPGEFEIQRSAGDLNHFEKIGAVASSGNAATSTAYQFPDARVAPGIVYYYRLRFTDLNGNDGFSKTEQAALPAGNDAIASVYPQPVVSGNPLRALLSCGDDEAVSWQLLDLTGKTVYQGETTSGNGLHELTLQTETFVPATYLLRVTVEGRSAVRRVAIL